MPDEIVDRIVQIRLAEPDCAEGFILDGYPRTIGQADALDAWLARADRALDAVVFFEIREEVLLRRLTGRRVCPTCGAIYHLDYKPPRVPGRVRPGRGGADSAQGRYAQHGPAPARGVSPVDRAAGRSLSEARAVSDRERGAPGAGGVPTASANSPNPGPRGRAEGLMSTMIALKSSAEIAAMRRCVPGRGAGAQGRRRRGRARGDDARARPDRGGPDPGPRGRAVVSRLPRVPGEPVHLRERRGRPRHPRPPAAARG